MKLGTERDVLLLDGECGLCNRLAQFVDKRRNKNEIIGFKSIHSEEGQALISTLTKKQQDADTVYLIRKKKAYFRSGAGIRILLYMKWYWKIWFPILWLVPLPIRNFVYVLIAKNRHRIFKKPTTCNISWSTE